mmetsp:Transcript_10902/g.24080  ORF Transcript_10902/g.24080 Transcript_10902/m.24080 type:complete len:970 (-) Transcript_10902:202-3111(-)
MGRSKNGAKKNGVRNSSSSSSSNGVSNSNNSARKTTKTAPSRFSINLSVVFLLLSFALSAIVAFSIGWIARLVLLSHFGLYPTANAESTTSSNNAALVALPTSSGMSKKSISTLSGASGKKTSISTQLPAPTVIEGKEVPFTTYASKTFQMAGAATSNTLHIDRSDVLIRMSRSKKEFDGGPDFQGESVESGESNGEEGKDGWVPCESNACSRGKDLSTSNGDYSEHNDDSDDLHLPAGQHLLIDIKDVDSNFLNSEERLATAMIELINESKLTLLSYHCHSLVPVGVSCAGVLLESHVAFHTWPLEGVITMDLFTCGGGLLIPTLPSIERLFAVPGVVGEEEGEITQPTLLWSHKLRGFREGFSKGYVRSKNPLDGSLGRYVLGKLDFDIKRPLLSIKTAIQNVNIYEVMEPKSRDVNSYHKSLLPAEDEEYESAHPQHFGPDKILFLDGIIQSTLYGDAPFHESIVHPAMITHSNPKRVAIIGGGEGATLREVLKYKSVEEVVILEIDEELVSICAEYMPEWSDCSDLQGSDSESCFEDSRARVVFVDAFKWFIESFGKDEKVEDKFDVIIMDALDPNTSVEIAGGLYNDNSFVDSLFNGLTAEGVFVVQMGKSKMSTDPPDEIGRFKDTGLMIGALEQSGFESIHRYDEGHSHFYMPWSYLVAFKDYESRAGWHRTAPELQIALQQRLHKTKSGAPVLRYFDAATMLQYQLPSKAQETTYCRKEEYPWECDEWVGIHPDYAHLPAAEYLKVDKSGVGEHAGRGLFAAQDIPKGATLALDEGGKAFHFPPLTWDVVESLHSWADDNDDTIPFVEDQISAIYTFVEGYGHGAVLLGKYHMAVDSGIMLFMNHGCNGTYNYGWVMDEDREIQFTETNVDLINLNLTEIAEHLLNEAQVYSPAGERNLWHTLNSGDYALRDIKKGEEVLTDYLAFVGSSDPDELKKDVLSLRAQCAGVGVGEITKYESES